MNSKKSKVTGCILGLGLLLAAGQPAQAMTVTQLEVTKGAVNYGGQHHEMMDRLLGQAGVLKMGHYQAIGEIVPSIDKAGETFSLFTSGFSGAPAPSAMISGSSIQVDLSSLFFGVGRGDSYHTLNIGGLATGLFNPETREFMVSWDHLFDNGQHEGQATFFLSGIAKFNALPTPIPAGLVLYATGLFGLGSWTWWSRRADMSVAV
ncbi:MAG: hypothetical protein NNA20_12405 [Nitrospira sp.]|nr:hypothetical protein [Nitrospira sp.]MCP9443376.1 hypothetical protein [Nitrospira sp.]